MMNWNWPSKEFQQNREEKSGYGYCERNDGMSIAATGGWGHAQQQWHSHDGLFFLWRYACQNYDHYLEKHQ